MGQGRSLSIADVLQQSARRRYPARKRVAAEAGEITRTELGAEQPCRTVQFKMPWWPARHAHVVAETTRVQLVLIDDKLRRAQPFELARDRLAVADFGHPEATARQVEPGDACTFTVGKYRRDQVVAGFGEQRLVR